MRRITFISLLVLLVANCAFANVTLPQILAHNMVLQREQPVAIWGWAAPGEHISVRFNKQVKETDADASGNWKVLLGAMAASAKPGELEISGKNTIILKNILVGEVWLCSGQSNMEYAMRKLAKMPPASVKPRWPVNAVEEANNPNIRIFFVNRKLLAKPDSLHKGWSEARDSALRAFSAVGYFFAKRLSSKLGVPIGMIESAVPGSAIEPWIPAEAFLTAPFFKDQKVGNDPGKFYNTMIAPMAPFTLRGFLWYQGETNCFLRETLSYTCKMDALISSWRNAWGKKELPFYYVQIAPFEYSKSKGGKLPDENTEPEFWEAQAAALKIRNTAMVVTTDLNENPADLHPLDKWSIGRRLGTIALAKTYGFTNMVWSGPVYKKMTVKKNVAVLDFDHIGEGLSNYDEKPLREFTIAGKDGKFYPANAVISGQQILVSADAVRVPTAVRFAWNEAPKANFYNKDGLPAMPFRTDNKVVDQFEPGK